MLAVEGFQDLTSVATRYRAVIEIADLIASKKDLPDLFPAVAQRLLYAGNCEFVQFALYDSSASLLRQQCITAAGRIRVPDSPLEGTAAGEVFRTQKPLVVPDLDLSPNSRPDGLPSNDIRSFCLIPMTTAGGPVGVLGFGSKTAHICEEPLLDFFMHVSEIVAVAAEAALAREREHEYVHRLTNIRERSHLLMEVNKLLFSELDPQALFAAISQSLHRLLKHDYAFLILDAPGTDRFHIHAMDPQPPSSFFPTGVTFAAERSASKHVLDTGKPLLLEGEKLRNAPFEVPKKLYVEGVRSVVYAPLIIAGRGLGTLALASMQPAAFTEDDVELLSLVAEQAAIAVQNAFAFGQVSELIDKLEEEKIYLESEIGSSYTPEEIVGSSEALAVVHEQVRTVAPTDATVLVLGETGTGKELITRAIHRLSERNRGAFVKLNCSAIPTGLLESELFGHEKGAFTGAIQQKVGRVELADKGTLFLDEVGDIPLDLQPKLLRVLQDQQFERLGSNHTLQVNVRIVAATNRNLEKMVEAGTFRRDLFYRLNVFPIHVPPLRERREDIPLLVRHFVAKFANRMNRRVGTIPPASMQALQNWSWPGNVRELENLIERAVILSAGRTLNVPLSQLKSSGVEPVPAAATTLAEADRAHILRTLRETKGVISGPAGAAARLGMKRTTLNYKMKKLGIDPRSL